MKKYHIAFVGMGSIGKRHLKNVCQLVASQGNSYSIDLYRSTLTRDLPEDIKGLVANQYLCSQAVHREYDMVFITNPTSLHLETAVKFQPHTKALFIEKPVFNTSDVEESIITILDSIYSYVACPLRYNPVLQYVKQHVDLASVISVRAISSSYLPDWRPGQDYRETYSAHAELGGGVDIDLIHEWDYLTWIFGMPSKCFVVTGQYSNLELNSIDTAIYVASNSKLSYELHLDYFGRHSQRRLEIFTHEDTIQCDLLKGKIVYLKEGREIDFNSERNAFQIAEIQHFLDITEGRTINDSSVRHGVEVLKLTKAKI